jgi:hypothetical protein
MDIYHIWANIEGDISDIDFANNIKEFLSQLHEEGKIESFRITRCKLGFRSIQDLPEWHIMMETKDMAQLESAFHRVARHDKYTLDEAEGQIDKKHKSFNQFVADDIQHALYRDWPDHD